MPVTCLHRQHMSCSPKPLLFTAYRTYTTHLYWDSTSTSIMGCHQGFVTVFQLAVVCSQVEAQKADLTWNFCWFLHSLALGPPKPTTHSSSSRSFWGPVLITSVQGTNISYHSKRKIIFNNSQEGIPVCQILSFFQSRFSLRMRLDTADIFPEIRNTPRHLEAVHIQKVPFDHRGCFKDLFKPLQGGPLPVISKGP